MFCDNCGTDNSENARFCKSCGAELINQQPKQVEKKMLSRKRSISKIIVGLIIVIIVAGIGTVAPGYMKEKQYERLLVQGDNEFQQGKYKEAMDTYIKATQIHDDDPALFAKIAEAAYEHYGYSSGEYYILDNYQKCISLDPDNMEAFERMLDVHANLKHFDKISEVCSQAMNVFTGEMAERYQTIKKRSDSYRAYKKYSNLVDRYTTSGYSWSNGKMETYGNCFTYLVDMDLDGIKELISAYSITEEASNDVNDYILEVWTNTNATTELIYEGHPYCSPTGNIDVVLLENEEGVCIKVSNELGKESIYRLENNKFVDATLDNKKSYTTHTYRISGAYTDAEKTYVKKAFNTVDLLNYEVLYLVNTTQHSVQSLINESEKPVIGTVKYGNYNSVNDDYNVYLWVYPDDNGYDKLDVIYIPKSDGMQYYARNVQFRFNPEIGIYEEYEEKYIDGEMQECAKKTEVCTISTSMEDGELAIMLMDGNLPGGRINANLECVEEW